MHHRLSIPNGIRTALLALMTMLIVAGMATAATAAQAKAKDHNRDGLPDRWEKRNHLSLKVNQARRDQDHDGVSNTCEFQARTSPRSKDSDRDGTGDGAEDHDGDGVSNRGESRGHSHCGDEDSDDDDIKDDDEQAGRVVSFENGVLTISAFAGGTVSGSVTGTTKIECEDDDDRPVVAVTSSRGSGDDGDDGDESDDDHCTIAELVPGAVVHEAELVDGVFVEIELIE
ncbi:MAG: hypothetical protein WAO61_08515 [Solirubrobacterales bacterium]